MTVRFHEGKGNVPLWAAVTVIVSILLAAGGMLFGVAQRSVVDKVQDVQLDVKDHSVRIGTLERASAVNEKVVEDVARSQKEIISMLTAIGSRLGGAE